MAAKVIGIIVLALFMAPQPALSSNLSSLGYRISACGLSSGGDDAASPEYGNQGPVVGQVISAPPGGAASPRYSTRPVTLAELTAVISLADGILDPENTSGETAVNDALIVMKAVMGEVTLTELQKAHADVAPLENGRPAPNGKVDLGDVLLILRRVVKLVVW
jgi:hypothetical protein